MTAARTREAFKPVYDADGITLYQGDCLEILPQLEAVDHVITDPPYSRDVYVRLGAPNSHAHSSDKSDIGLGRTAKTMKQARKSVLDGRSGKAQGINHQYSSMSIEKLAAGDIGHIDEMIEPLAVEFARIVTRWCIVYSDVETCHRWRAQLEGAGMRYVRTGAWVKPDPMPQFSGDRPSVGFEPCTIAHAKGPMRWNGGGLPAVWTYFTAKGSERPDHPCPKPLPLMRRLIEQFTDAGDLILDPFAGSGTTLRAAKDLGRRAIGIEINPDYCNVAIERMAQGVLL